MARTFVCCVAALAVAVSSCAAPVRCGDGTVLIDGACVVDRDSAASADRPSDEAPLSSDGARADAIVRDDAAQGDVATAVDVASAADSGMDASAADVVPVEDSAVIDTGVTDAGPLELRPDDTLLFRSATASMLPGHALCPTLTVLRADGTRVAVQPGSAMVTIVPNDTSVLEVARPGECGPLGGVVALAPRATTARWTVQSMGMSVSAVLGVTVLDGRVQFETADSATVPLGGEVEYRTVRRHELTAGGGASIAADVYLVRRFFNLSSEPAGLISAGALNTTDGRVNLRGLALGTGRLVGGYGPPGRVTPINATGTLTVVNPGTITSVGPLFYYRDGAFASQGAPTSMTVGDCLEVRVEAQFTSGTSTYRQIVTSGVALTALGDGRIDSGPPSRVCATARGELSVRACVGAVCTVETVPVMVAGQPAPTLTLSPPSVTFVQSILGAFNGCVPLRATLRYADGATRDVTDSRATRWFAAFTAGSPPVNFLRATTGDAPRNDPSGNPCFTALGPATRMYDFFVDVSYGGVAAMPRLSVAVR